MGEPKPLTAYQQSYHWRNKNCGPWAHDWVKRTLPGIRVEEGEAHAEISSVTSVSGDCDLGQRKGKLLTIYDLEVELRWEGKTADGEDAKGDVKIPEFSHEAIDGLSEYVYEITLISPSSASGNALLALLRKSLPPLLTDKFNSFRGALLDAHGLFTDTLGTTPSASGSTTPAGAAAGYSPAPPTRSETGSPAPAAKKADGDKTKKGKVLAGTTTVEVEAQLRASADDLWGLLTDPGKIPMWSRSPAKITLEEGAPFELFDGNIRGKIVSSEPPKKLVQSWQVRSPSWPGDHYGIMSITLDQGSDSTQVTFKLEGVPSGQDEDIKRALDTYYIRGLKQMGLGTIL